MKAYTDLNQSKKLAEILPLESADMHYNNVSIKGINYVDEYRAELMEYNRAIKVLSKYTINPLFEIVPCWSLAALSEFILPYIADDDGNNYKFYLSKDGLDRWIAYYKSDDVSIHICEESDNMIDVILEMVCWLKKEEYI